MPTREYAGHTVEVTEDGFLADQAQWSREIATAIAEEVGLTPLTDKHWQVVEFCRADTASAGKSPGLRRISKQSGVTMKELYQLFPKGPGKLAAQIAGVPKPQSCI